MPRILTVLFRRDPQRDCRHGAVSGEGYQMLWPDGRPVTVGIENFCQHGQRCSGWAVTWPGFPSDLSSYTATPWAASRRR